VLVFSLMRSDYMCAHVEHDPMTEIVAKPLYVTLLDLLLEFRRSESALRVTQ
jgi:hypothetical protein